MKIHKTMSCFRSLGRLATELSVTRRRSGTQVSTLPASSPTALSSPTSRCAVPEIPVLFGIYKKGCEPTFLRTNLLFMYGQHSVSSQTFDPRVSYVIRRICQNAKSKILLSDLAEEARLTPSHLQHLFRKNVGRSVKNLMSELRLIQAEFLLKHSQLTVAEVARQVGFEDRSNFHRSFKKQFGVTPLSVRKPWRTAPTVLTPSSNGHNDHNGNNGNNGNGHNGTNGNGSRPTGRLILLLQEKKTRLIRLEGQVELLEGLLNRSAANSVPESRRSSQVVG